MEKWQKALLIDIQLYWFIKRQGIFKQYLAFFIHFDNNLMEDIILIIFFQKNTIFLSVIQKLITTFAPEWWFKNTSLAWGRIEKGIRCESGTESPAVSSCNLDFAQHKSFFPYWKREDKQNRNKSEDLPSTALFALGNFEQIGESFFIIYNLYM